MTMDNQRGSAHTVYLQPEDVAAIEEVRQRFGLTFSAVLRFIRRQWSEYDELFTDPEQARRIIEDSI